MRDAWALRLSVRLAAIALLAFPRAFRERHGQDALAYFQDRARDRLERRGPIGLAALVGRNLVNTVAAGLAERRRIRLETGVARRRRVLATDVVHGLRALRRRPGFVFAAGLPIALGVAGVTAVFAVVDGVLLRPLPYEDPESLVAVGRPLGNGVLGTVSAATLIDIEGEISGLEALGGAVGGSVVLKGADPEEVRVTKPTRHFMDIFGLAPALGRGFTPEDFEVARVALITWRFWQRRWGGDPAVLGQTIETDAGDFEVVGVLPEAWRAPEAIAESAGDLWIPLGYTDPWVEATRAFGFASGAGRLAPGASLAVVNEQLRVAADRLWRAFPESSSERDGSAKPLEARPLRSETVGDIGSRLRLLLGAVAVLLAIACANVANLFLAQGAGRERELAVRSALGAGRSRLGAQLLTETVAVALAGGAFGLLLAYLSVDAMVAFMPDLPLAESVSVDLRVAGVAFVVSLLSGVAFGFVPALTASRQDPGRALRGGSQPRRGPDRVRGVLVVGQIALALVLVTGGGLLVNSVVRLALVDIGFRSDHVVTLRPRLNPRAYGADSPPIPFFETFFSALSAIPAVRDVSATMFGPGQGLPVAVKVANPVTGEETGQWRHTVWPGFFRTLDIAIVEGRPFGPGDVAGAVRAAVVSRSLANALWPGEPAIGRELHTDDGSADRIYTVVGVAADIHNRGPRLPAEPVFYESYLQNPWLPSLDVLLRHEGDLAAIVPSIRAALRSADPTVPLADLMPLETLLAAGTAEQRHYALLLGIFSLIALAIAAVGVYATVSYAVARRLREMGIRRAVGARREDVAWLVIGRGMRQSGTGAALGIALALSVTRYLDNLLFEISPFDPLTFVMVGGVLLGTAFVACLVPAVRAMRADPLAILRAD